MPLLQRDPKESSSTFTNQRHKINLPKHDISKPISIEDKVEG